MEAKELLERLDKMPMMHGDYQLDPILAQDLMNYLRQAEITWKARDKEIEAAKQAGRQEVIEFCQDNQMPDAPESSPYPGLVIISKERWEAKLKEWE